MPALPRSEQFHIADKLIDPSREPDVLELDDF